MKFEDYKNCSEVISEKEFLNFLHEFFNNKIKFSKDDLLEILLILGDKYVKFYGDLKLTEDEKNNLYLILVECTNFNDLNLIEDLISLMFSFRIDKYYFFLKNNINLIFKNEVKNEIFEALDEYLEFLNLLPPET